MTFDLDQRLRAWVDADLISPQQAAAIRGHEQAGTGPRERRDVGGRRATLVEAIGYLGAALAVVAGGLVIGQYWPQIAPWGRVVLTATLTLAVGAAGAALRGSAQPPVQRLVGLLWFATSVGTAFVVGVAAEGLAGAADRDQWLAVAVAVLVVSAVLHRLWPRSLQLVALAGGTVGTALAAVAYPHAAVAPLAVGLLVWALGVAWVLLAAGGWLLPATTGQVLGLLGVGAGAQAAATGDHIAAGLLLALVSTALVLWAAAAAGSTLLLGFAVAGVVLFVPQAVFHFFGDSLGAPLALLLTGLLLVAAAVGLALLRREIDDGAATGTHPDAAGGAHGRGGGVDGADGRGGGGGGA